MFNFFFFQWLCVFVCEKLARTEGGSIPLKRGENVGCASNSEWIPMQRDAKLVSFAFQSSLPSPASAPSLAYKPRHDHEVNSVLSDCQGTRNALFILPRSGSKKKKIEISLLEKLTVIELIFKYFSEMEGNNFGHFQHLNVMTRGKIIVCFIFIFLFIFNIIYCIYLYFSFFVCK